MPLRPRTQAQRYRERHGKKEDDQDLYHATLFGKEQGDYGRHEQHDGQEGDD
jgi:hypothetical protein